MGNFKDFCIQLIVGVLLIFIAFFFAQKILIPKTDIEVTCEGMKDLNQEILGFSEALSINFKNNARFSGKDFNILFENIPYKNIEQWKGISYDGYFLCNLIENDLKFAYFKCDYLPPKSTIEINIAPIIKENISVIYWSETTPKKELNLNC